MSRVRVAPHSDCVGFVPVTRNICVKFIQTLAGSHCAFPVLWSNKQWVSLEISDVPRR